MSITGFNLTTCQFEGGGSTLCPNISDDILSKSSKKKKNSKPLGSPKTVNKSRNKNPPGETGKVKLKGERKGSLNK